MSELSKPKSIEEIVEGAKPYLVIKNSEDLELMKLKTGYQSHRSVVAPSSVLETGKSDNTLS